MNPHKYSLKGLTARIAALAAFLVAVATLLDAGSALIKKTQPLFCTLGIFIPWCSASSPPRFSPANSVCVISSTGKRLEQDAARRLHKKFIEHGLSVADDCNDAAAVLDIIHVVVDDPTHYVTVGPPAWTTTAHIDVAIKWRADGRPSLDKASVSASASGAPTIELEQLTEAAENDALERLVDKVVSLTGLTAHAPQ